MVIKKQNSEQKIRKYNLKIKTKIKPDIRFLHDMKEVLYDKEWAKKTPNFEVYYMYRSVKEKDGLRYDITVTSPRMLGKEFSKTLGHEHSFDYGELYIVLEGKAIFLFQKYKNNKIEDVCTVKANKGNAVIIPPHYGHIMINPSKNKRLKTANWSNKNCRNIYNSIIKKQRGACYYYTKSGWIKNKKYSKIPKLKFKKPLKKLPKNLDFLKT